MPRINFVSLTFLFAFGLGSFVGIALALLAVALARPEDETTVIEPTRQAAVPEPTATLTATPEPTATPTPVPPPRTLSTLQVRIGPAQQYAILGTLARGNEVSVQGRNTGGDWLAIEFPPGSAARGWIPAEAVDGLTLMQVFRLDVLQASLIETSLGSATPSSLEGNDGLPPRPASTATPTRTPPRPPSSATATTPATTPTPSVVYGPTDLAITAVTLTTGGGVSVVVANQGRGDVPSVSVVVSAVGFATETLSGGLLLTGASVTLVTGPIALLGPTEVTVTVTPGGQHSDVNPANDSITVVLSP